MARLYITFSVDLDEVEADILPSSRKAIEELCDESALVAADVMSDIAGVSESLYSECVAAMRKEWELIRENAKANDD